MINGAFAVMYSMVGLPLLALLSCQLLNRVGTSTVGWIVINDDPFDEAYIPPTKI